MPHAVVAAVRPAGAVRRALAASAAALLGLAVLLAGVGPARADALEDAAGATVAEERLLAAIAAERAAAGVPPLHWNVVLHDVARAWSDVQRARDDMGHNPDAAAQYGLPVQLLGENVGHRRDPSADVVAVTDRLHQAFMESSGHRRNVLDARWNQIAVGASWDAAAHELWLTVNFLAGPVPDVPAEPAPVAAPAPVPAQVGESVAVSRGLFADGGAEHVVLARADAFADALGGAGLAGDAGPVLLTPGPTAADPSPLLDADVRAELDRVLGDGGRVYVLGGPAAVPSAVDDELVAAGHDVSRLAGATRVETALRVAAEIEALRGTPAEVLLARADDWADAVAGGAYAADRGVPVLLTPSDALHPSVAAHLRERASGATVWALGGSAALTDGTVAAAGATRVDGVDRTATAVSIARRLWGAGDAAEVVVVPAYDADGWAYALVHAPYSARHDAPQLLVGDAVPAAVAAYLSDVGAAHPTVTAASPVPTAVVDELEALAAA